MPSYEPGPELVKAVLAGLLAPLPYVAAVVARSIPFKETAVGKALQHVVPVSLRAIASTQGAGARIALTRHGELTEEAKQNILRRIAGWFVPSEVQDVTKALQQDIIRLGREGFGEEAWKLEAAEGEIVLVVLNTSFLKVTADTVADMFMDSFERLKVFKNRLPFVRSGDAPARAAALAARLPGIALLAIGISWHPSEAERAVVHDLLAALKGQHALHARTMWAEPGRVVASIEELQRLLADVASRAGDGSPARDGFAIMRAACRDFAMLPGMDELAKWSSATAPAALVCCLRRNSSCISAGSGRYSANRLPGWATSTTSTSMMPSRPFCLPRRDRLAGLGQMAA